MAIECPIMLADRALRGLLLAALLLAASASDIQTRRIPNRICALLAAMGLIPFSSNRLWGMALALPFLITAMCRDKSVSGGDVKLTAAAGLSLGLPVGFLGLVIGMMAVTLWHIAAQIICRVKHQRALTARESALPLAPFLSVGFIAAYFMI